MDTSFPYREAIGMFMYLAISTGPDLAYAVGQLSQFVAKPSAKHVGTLKLVLRYLAGTLDYGITYSRQWADTKEIVLEVFCDSDWATDPEQRKSTTGFVFTLAGGAIAWMSRPQTIIALSTAATEYVAACEASMEAVVKSNILQEILPHHTINRGTRHIELRWNYMRDQVQKGAIDLHTVKGEQNPADTFMKPLDKMRLKELLFLTGVGNCGLYLHIV
ncbi:hypothetical protein PC119_g2427 [Phytophthora cactorum]|nr:hypothetical protein PC119_g2427 [Phytophthora cactorum]